MGVLRIHPPVLLLIAAFGVPEESVEIARKRAEEEFGPIALESEPYRFGDFTQYYAKEMAPDLLKRFWVFENLIDAAKLPDIKLKTNDWEEEIGARLKAEGKSDAKRPLNLDPGYLDLGKLILASTKDHAHRIYLDKGILAETTLMYTQKHWVSLPWTYNDYKDEKSIAFFNQCRAYLYRRYEETGNLGPRRPAPK